MFKIVNQEKFNEELIRIVSIECPNHAPICNLASSNNGANCANCFGCWLLYMGLEYEEDKKDV